MRSTWGGVLAGTTVVAALALGCASDEEPRSIKEVVEENSTLLTDLGSYQSAVRDDAAERLKAMGQEQGVALILYLLGDPNLEDDRVEVILARILADWEDRRAVPYLLSFLTHPDLGIQRNAIEGLLLFPDDPRVIAAFEELLASKSDRDRKIATEALTLMKGNDRAFRLCAEQISHETDPEIRAQLIVYVAGSKNPDRKHVLIDALDDVEVVIREFAWNGLQDYKDLPRQVRYSPLEPPNPEDPEVARERERNLRILRLWAQGVVRGR